VFTEAFTGHNGQNKCGLFTNNTSDKNGLFIMEPWFAIVSLPFKSSIVYFYLFLVAVFVIVVITYAFRIVLSTFVSVITGITLLQYHYLIIILHHSCTNLTW